MPPVPPSERTPAASWSGPDRRTMVPILGLGKLDVMEAQVGTRRGADKLPILPV